MGRTEVGGLGGVLVEGLEGQERRSASAGQGGIRSPQPPWPPPSDLVPAKRSPWQANPGEAGLGRSGSRRGQALVTSMTGSVEYCFRTSRTSGFPMAPRASPEKKNHGHRSLLVRKVGKAPDAGGGTTPATPPPLCSVLPTALYVSCDPPWPRGLERSGHGPQVVSVGIPSPEFGLGWSWAETSPDPRPVHLPLAPPLHALDGETQVSMTLQPGDTG